MCDTPENSRRRPFACDDKTCRESRLLLMGHLRAQAGVFTWAVKAAALDEFIDDR